MTTNPYSVIADFEAAVAEYTGAPYCVAVNSCTNALFLCLMYRKLKCRDAVNNIILPNKTYVSVPMQIVHAGYNVLFSEQEWEGIYRLYPFYIYDAARRFTKNMFKEEAEQNGHTYMCTSHHWSKILGVQHGGCILHDDLYADAWFRRARHDGRLPGESAGQAAMIGYHCPMPPENAAAGLVRLSLLPDHNEDLPNSDYPDLSKMRIFQKAEHETIT